MERLLHEMPASVDWNILRLIRVSLKREENLACMLLASSTISHPLLCFVSVALVLRQRRRAYVAGRGDPGVGGSRRYGGHPHRGGTCCIDFCKGGSCGVG
jgi:hypothetical protein